VDLPAADLVARGLFDPTVAYLLFVIGSYALLVEQRQPIGVGELGSFVDDHEDVRT
jgi:hypothetical protein